MDKKFKLIARPDKILNEQNQYFLFFLMMKISPYFTFFFSKYTNIKPNTISLFSIFFLFLSLWNLFIENYAYSFFFLFMNLFLDNIDGELARVNNQASKFGELLEKINSDLFYLFFYNLIAYKYFNDQLIELRNFIFFIFISLLYFLIRSRISHITIPETLKLNQLNTILFGLFKYSDNIRINYRISRVIYIFFWNVISSGGVSEIIFAFLLIMNFDSFAIKYIFFYYFVLFIYIILLFFTKSYLKRR
jgi:phosphatidylglycerophosphate synthase